MAMIEPQESAADTKFMENVAESFHGCLEEQQQRN